MDQTRCLNMEVLRECFGANRKYIRGSMWFYLGGAALLLLMAGLLYGVCLVTGREDAVGVALFFCLMIPFILVIGWRQVRVQRGIDRLAFCLVEDVCTGKSIEMDRTDVPSKYYYLHFEHYGKMEMRFKQLHLINQYGVSAHKTYENAEEGDVFYLLKINNDKKPVCIFNKKEWTLDASEFKEENGCIRPVGSGAGR